MTDHLQHRGGSPTLPSRSRRLWAAVVVTLLFFGIIAYVLVDRTLYSRDAVLVGTWDLDAESIQWLGRTCAMMNFGDQPPRIVVTRTGDDVSVRFNDATGTAFVGRQAGGRVSVRQMVPATETGRFCSDPLVVQIRLSIRATTPDLLRARWTLPNCDVCPDQRFTAQRLSN